jgi:hypothetical protein
MRLSGKSQVSLPQPDDSAAALACLRFRLALGAFTLLMLGLSAPLWGEDARFPRVPFVPGLPLGSGPACWVVFGILVAGIILAMAGIAWQAMFGLSAITLAFLIAQDQHRFQPWAYQFGMSALALATCSKARALGLCRLFIVALYLHSGLSKLDVSFCQELGLSFLATAVRPIGLHPARWPAAVQVAAILIMPAWEIVVAAGLCIKRTRGIAILGAVCIHLALLAILSPSGLGHSTIVLVWNAAMIVEVIILFGSMTPALATSAEAEPRLVAVTRWVFVVAVLMPFGERAGLWDTWPSFALYASHAERTDVLVHDDDMGVMVESIGSHTTVSVGGGWNRLNLTEWSRSVRGVPVYPQGRACNGLAEALAARYHGAHPLRVTQWGRADLWTGRRSRVELWGEEAIRRQGDRYRLNAHPAPWPAKPLPNRPGPKVTKPTGIPAAYLRGRETRGCPQFGSRVKRWARKEARWACGCRERAESCFIPPRCRASSALATWARRLRHSSSSSPRRASGGGRSCRWARPDTATHRTSRTRRSPATRS